MKKNVLWVMRGFTASQPSMMFFWPTPIVFPIDLDGFGLFVRRA